MKLLVVRKSTNLERHGELVKRNISRGFVDEAKLVALQTAHDEHYRCLDSLFERLDSKAIDYQLVDRGSDFPTEYNFNYVVTVGGDGTLLSASHFLSEEIKIIGVRSSSSSVGYLCAAGAADLDVLVGKLAEEALSFVGVQRLKLKVHHIDEEDAELTVPILNDVLFCARNPAATSRYRIGLGELSEVQKSSGVWVATPAGSTAAIGAAGGKRMELLDKRFQFMVRELYRERENFQIYNDFFDPDENPLVIDNRNEQAILALDGQHGSIPLSYGDRCEFGRGPLLKIALPQSRS